MTDWNPDLYLAYADERARPALDLIARLPNREPKQIYDLGCGPGNATELLHRAFPTAEIIGIDSSPAMIAKARAALPSLRFELGDVRHWMLPADTDVVFSNALFQWLPDHGQVLRRMLEALRPGAQFAHQMPDNLAEPSHRVMAETALNGPWKKTLEQALKSRSSLLSPGEYYDLLKPHCKTFEIWRTTYHHALSGLDGIIAMLSSTGLKPYLDPLDEGCRSAYLDLYRENLRKHYPAASDGKVLFAFPRLFILCVK